MVGSFRRGKCVPFVLRRIVGIAISTRSLLYSFNSREWYMFAHFVHCLRLRLVFGCDSLFFFLAKNKNCAQLFKHKGNRSNELTNCFRTYMLVIPAHCSVFFMLIHQLICGWIKRYNSGKLTISLLFVVNTLHDVTLYYAKRVQQTIEQRLEHWRALCIHLSAKKINTNVN